MDKFGYDNIDLFYYHSTDIDITRIHSILRYGILSSSMIFKNDIPYYHRNYKNASCGDDYISVSHFSRTFWHHFHLENELYDSSANKFVFVISGEVDALEKQKDKKRYIYTTERHVKDFINKEDILGIIIREHDINKQLKDIPFTLNYSDWNDSIKKCFDTVHFLQDIHHYGGDITNLYLLIGLLVEAKVSKSSEYKKIEQGVSNYMQEYIATAYEKILNISNPTLKDFILLYSEQIPIYVMNRYDLKDISSSDSLIKTAKEKYEITYPGHIYPKISKNERLSMKNEEQLRLQEVKLEEEMIPSDQLIYLDGFHGPLTKEGEQIKQKILKIKQNS